MNRLDEIKAIMVDLGYSIKEISQWSVENEDKFNEEIEELKKVYRSIKTSLLEL